MPAGELNVKIMKFKSKKYSIPSENNFIDCIKMSFAELTFSKKYKIVTEKNDENSCKIEYLNSIIGRRIEFINQNHPCDYGFSIFIYNTYNNIKDDSICFCNIPFENQNKDNDCNFINKLSKMFFKEMDSIISGVEWKNNLKTIHQF
ncbi:MAG: hypothetical protein ACD_12C00037G0001 [uncultured bacterium]|nr:MAG: hypothetical protein ACD_12C00037G0001 [uncultured bacterium]